MQDVSDAPSTLQFGRLHPQLFSAGSRETSAGAQRQSELRRRIFLHNLIEGVNTAEIRAVPDESPRPAPSAKNFNSLGLVGEQDGGAHLPQETHKVLSYKEPLPKTPGKKKKGKPGKRKEQDKRKRRERSALERLQEPPGSASWWEELNLRTVARRTEKSQVDRSGAGAAGSTHYPLCNQTVAFSSSGARFSRRTTF
ncbi:parathyroid hormone-related protein isoform X2 [Ascaphus truei]|uniref:parathyroid hormone-related protein isoform X2 n=1 Tax=Ascaphus truei TaxID=8439 RepID=UPI003F5A7397